MKHDKGFLAKNPKPTTDQERAALQAVVAAIKAIPRGCFVELDDNNGEVCLLRRETPGFGRAVASAKIAPSRISL